MNLCYQILWHNRADYFAHWIEDLLKNSGAQGRVLRTETAMIIDAQGDEAALTRFADDLQLRLPHSLFLGEASPLQSVPENARALAPRLMPEGLFVLPQTAQKLLDRQNPGYFNLFLGCDESGVQPIESASLRLEGIVTGFTPQNCETLFSQMAQYLQSGRTLHFQTSRGVLALSAQSISDRPPLVLVAHTRLLEAWQLSQSAFLRLSAVEKPALELPCPMIEAPFFGAARLQLPFDVPTLLLCRALQETGLDAVYALPATDRADFSYTGGASDLGPLLIAELPQGFALLQGGAALLPKRFVAPKSPALGLCGLVGTLWDNDAVLIDRADRLPAHPVSQLKQVGPNNNASHPNTVSIGSLEAAVLSVLLEHGLHDQKAVAAHLSWDDPQSGIAVYDPKTGFKRTAGFAPLPQTGVEVVAALSSMDESAPVLLSNVRKKFPGLIEGIEATRFGPAPRSFFALLGLLCGLEAANETLLTHALLAPTYGEGCKGGVKIDFKLGADRQIDWRWSARTILSFRMADVPMSVLIPSLFESFADLAVMQLGELRTGLSTPVIAASGDLCASPIVAQKLHDHFARFFKLCYNRELPVQGANQAFGALYL